MRIRNLLLVVLGLTLAVLLPACGQSEAERLAQQKELLIGRWQNDDGRVLDFRAFTVHDPGAWKNLGGDQQDGVVTISNPSQGQEEGTALYRLTEKGMLVITVQTQAQPVPGISMNLQNLYSFESVSKDSLVIRFLLSADKTPDEYRRISEAE